ncbi:hypothetical protein [Leptospira brenneri]|uniref:hypothetical protein n=1 Tax=Leptospira brenneri TaxID=2023182 RepID=UPI0013FD6A44|nr:hypothetical protein [Leptospira brenneri]
MPSFENYSAYILTDSSEHLFITFPNFWYSLISDNANTEKEKIKKITSKIKTEKIQLSLQESKRAVKFLEEDFKLKTKDKNEKFSVMDGTTIEVYSSKFENFKQYKGNKNREKFKILEEKLEAWDYKFFNKQTQKMKDYFENVSKLHVKDIAYKSKNKFIKEPSLDLTLNIEIIANALNLILSGESQKLLKTRKGKELLLSQISAMDSKIFSDLNIDQISIQIQLLTYPIKKSF